MPVIFLKPSDFGEGMRYTLYSSLRACINGYQSVQVSFSILLFRIYQKHICASFAYVHDQSFEKRNLIVEQMITENIIQFILKFIIYILLFMTKIL